MSRRLSTNVVVGEVTYAGGTIPPANVAKQITNPAAWEAAPDEPAPVPAIPEPKTPRRRPSKATTGSAATGSDNGPQQDGSGTGAKSEGAGATGDETGGSEPPSTKPPAGNASTEVWAAFAQTVGVQVPDDAGREDIKSALSERGLLEPSDS